MARKTTSSAPPPIVVLFGDDGAQRAKALEAYIARLLPDEADRGMALSTYDADPRRDEAEAASLGGVFTDLMTPAFLGGRRVVVVRSADSFISAHRDRLEAYAQKPSPFATLMLECRSFPSNTKLYKAVAGVGGEIQGFEKPKEYQAVPALGKLVQEHGCRIAPEAAVRLIELVGHDTEILTREVEKLALYVGKRREIATDDVAVLVGQTREEKIFAVMDAAGLGKADRALQLWEQTLASDPEAPFKVVGGIAYVLRRWLTAHQLLAQGLSPAQIAPKVVMWRREAELAVILARLPAQRVRAALAALARLDTQAKTGLRSIERGVELLLVRLAAPAA